MVPKLFFLDYNGGGNGSGIYFLNRTGFKHSNSISSNRFRQKLFLSDMASVFGVMVSISNHTEYPKHTKGVHLLFISKSVYSFGTDTYFLVDIIHLVFQYAYAKDEVQK